MSDRSAIEWTDATWNPTRGCTKVSPGCKHCYAETFAERFRGVAGHPYEHGFDLRLVPGKLTEPFRWTGRRTVFVNSMSDLFHEAIPESFVTAVAQVMRATPWHTYQVLTKRSDRLQRTLSGPLRWAGALPNVWWGVSVENRKFGVSRIAALRGTPAHTRFLSVEPLLDDLGQVDLSDIHWVIVGGESGHGARPMKEAWVLTLLRQCQDFHIPFFFKQWGGLQKKRNGRLLRGRTYDQMPPRSAARLPTRGERQHLAAEFDRLALAYNSLPLRHTRKDTDEEVSV